MVKELRYFSLSEFRCKCNQCKGYPAGGMSNTLLLKLDELREKLGYPIYVSSGYRCEYWNQRNGGVDNSTHTLGQAADIYSDYATTEKLLELAEKVGFDGIGYYPNEGFIHVDCRCDGRKPNYYRW